jgi:NTE family protein
VKPYHTLEERTWPSSEALPRSKPPNEIRKINNGQVVIVLQGGGALGAYQGGVYQALHEAGIEPDWVIGTSIGAINGALIAGNAPHVRVARLIEFWSRVGQQLINERWSWPHFTGIATKISAMTRGVPGFFHPNPEAAFGLSAPLGVDRAAFYTTGPLKATLQELVDFDCLRAKDTRLTVGAVNVRTGDMTCFDSRDMTLAPEHVMASGALPPIFPAIRIDGEAYWDGGICSNTPIEVVLDDNPRRNSLMFSVNVWQKQGPEPNSIWQAISRHKDIQYASRLESQVARQEQLHRLRRIIREFAAHIPQDRQNDPEVQELAAYGCSTTMHLVELLVPRRDTEDHTKDIDFTRASIHARWHAGYADAQHVVREQPWTCKFDPLEGVIVHRRSGATHDRPALAG